MVLYGILIRNEAGEAINFTALSVKSPEAVLEWAKRWVRGRNNGGKY